MPIHEDWNTPGFGLDPVADAVGPFVGRHFLETWWRHRGRGELMLVESASALLPLHRWHGTVGFLGEADLTDYHSPLGSEVAEAVMELGEALHTGDRLILDSLPSEAADALEAALVAAGLAPSRVEHEVAAILDLPASRTEYLAALSGKQRHEVGRKWRRFEEAFGKASLVREPDRLDTFVAMHRAARGGKGSFMTSAFERLFADLLRLRGAVLDVLVSEAGEPIAAAFGFEDQSAYYLYNSGYAPQAGPTSPGVVLIYLLIDRAIAAGRTRFDFLKGAEGYKFRMGARRRPLWRLEVVR